MSKNTGDTRFRKVDVDQYTDSAFQDEQLEDGGATTLNISDANNLITNGRMVDALMMILQNAPVETKDQSIKDAALRLVMRVLSQIKTPQIDEVIAALDDSKIDLLMKYIYRGFEQPFECSNAVLLTWHEKVYARGKAGSIIRVLTDRKRV